MLTISDIRTIVVHHQKYLLETWGECALCLTHRAGQGASGRGTGGMTAHQQTALSRPMYKMSCDSSQECYWIMMLISLSPFPSYW